MAIPGLEDDEELDDEAPASEPGAKGSLGMSDMMGESPAMGMRDDFTAAAEEAFPEIAGQPERIEALKSAIRICLEEDQSGGYGDEKKDKPKGGLALIFGSPKSKSK